MTWTALASTANAAGVVEHFELQTPRDFGYVIGDVIEHRMELEIIPGHYLDEDSLPPSGRAGRWLELRRGALETDETGRRYGLRLRYQVFNTPDRRRRASTPQHELSVVGPESRIPVLIPPWSFGLSPLTPGPADTPLSLTNLQPDRAPQPVVVAPHLYRLAALTVAVAALLGHAAHRRWGSEWLRRRRGPFALTVDRIRRLATEPASGSAYREGLRHVHQAFNHTAGRVLHHDTLDEFFMGRPAFAVLRTEIETLFGHSRGVFYGGSGQESTTAPSSADFRSLLELCRRCRTVERRGP